MLLLAASLLLFVIEFCKWRTCNGRRKTVGHPNRDPKGPEHHAL
ncbi:hypothetical protein ABIA27_001386 [Sinorhizobium fredii]